MFSLVIPAYNDAEGVARLLARLDAMGEDVEAIVIDDASPDPLADRLADRAPGAHVDLKILRNETNLGPGPSRNRGLAEASRDFLLFLDADDLLCPQAFAALRDNLPRSPCDFTLFRYHLVSDPAAPHTYRMLPRDEAIWTAARETVDLDGPILLADAPDLTRCAAFPWNKLYRTAFLREADVVFPDLRLHEDVEPHWCSFIMAERFRVLDSGPPLIQHFRLDSAARATDDATAQRLDAFTAIGRCFNDLAPLREDAEIFAQFARFALDLAGWSMAKFRGDPLSARAQAAATSLFARLNAHAEERGWLFVDPHLGLSLADAAEAPLLLAAPHG